MLICCVLCCCFSEKEKLKPEKDKIATKKDLSDLDVRFSEFFKSLELILSILYSTDNKVHVLL